MTLRPRISLDTNAIIDLEQSRAPIAAVISELIALDVAGRIRLCVSAIAASERTRDGRGIQNFSIFMERLEKVGLGAAEVLLPIAYSDVTFFDQCVFATDEGCILEDRIWEILFPGRRPKDGVIPPSLRNLHCDVLGMWCHITYRCNIFVTSDGNFHRKRPALVTLGAQDILYPDEALLRQLR